jgi:hypothetical protein
VARLLHDKAANQSVGYTARLHVAAWQAYGVSSSSLSWTT